MTPEVWIPTPAGLMGIQSIGRPDVACRIKRQRSLLQASSVTRGTPLSNSSSRPFNVGIVESVPGLVVDAGMVARDQQLNWRGPVSNCAMVCPSKA